MSEQKDLEGDVAKLHEMLKKLGHRIMSYAVKTPDPSTQLTAITTLSNTLLLRVDFSQTNQIMMTMADAALFADINRIIVTHLHSRMYTVCMDIVYEYKEQERKKGMDSLFKLTVQPFHCMTLPETGQLYQFTDVHVKTSIGNWHIIY